MALSITTIGVDAGDGDREPTHTGAISMFMDNHEPVARASRVGRTAKVSGVDNTETGGGDAGVQAAPTAKKSKSSLKIL